MSAPQYHFAHFLVDLGNRRFLHQGREVALLRSYSQQWVHELQVGTNRPSGS